MATSKVKIVHVINCLDVGGAEMMLYRLLSGFDQTIFDSKVISLTTVGTIGEKIDELGVPIKALLAKRGALNPMCIVRLAEMLKQDRPHIIQTWMYHSNLVGGLAAKLVGDIPVIWGIHHSNLDARCNKKSTIWVAKLCGYLSGYLPARVICCSEASKIVHVEHKYKESKMQVIPNGFDLELYKPNRIARDSVRRELGIDDTQPLIGLIARFDPLKDHLNLIRAAALINKRVPNVRFLICGKDVTTQNIELMTWIKSYGVEDNFFLLGLRDDVPRLTAALDIATSSSFGEGFPNAVGEAMACGVPCVVTDVGDSAIMVGETGTVVPPKNPELLADAWCNLLSMDRESRQLIGHNARFRVEKNYSLTHITREYEKTYLKLLGDMPQ